MIKICFLSLNAYSLFNPNRTKQVGGAEVDVYIIASELAKDKNFQISFVVSDFGQPDKESYGPITLYKAYPLPIFGWRRFLYYIIGIPILFRSLFKSNADIYFYEAPGMEAGLLALFCRLFRKKMIYRTASTIDCDGQYRRENPFKGWLFEYGLKNADYIVAENNDAKNLLQKYYSLDSEVIYDTTPFPKNLTPRPPSERKNILWIGRVVKIKNPMLFLKLAEKNPDKKFLMIALEEKREKDLFIKIHEIAKTIDNLTIIDGVPHHEVNKYYLDAKIQVNTSDYEGFPNVFIEGGILGVPILSLNVNTDSFLTKYEVGLFAHGNIDYFHLLFKQIINDGSTLDQMSKKINIYTKENHDINYNVEKYKKIILDLSR